MTIFCYDLDQRLPTYDFFFWAAHARMLGASAIEITDGSCYMERKPHLGWPNPREETRRRRDHYMLTSGPLLGLPVRIGEHGDRTRGSHMVADIWRDAQRPGGGVPKMRAPYVAGVRYTVTLREHFYKPARNSDWGIWRRFAEAIGAEVIEDHDVRPITLLDRMALYAGARMNFGVPNGPFSILYLTDYPFAEFCDPHNKLVRKDFHRQGIDVGGQIPWLQPGQRQVWEIPSYDTLMREFEQGERLWQGNHG